MAVIAEVKRRSPSKGDLFADLDPARLAGTYESAGARCISVLTDANNFGGSPEDLQAARSAVSLPVIRKDFTVSPLDVLDARLMGADCVLLIVAALDDSELADFGALAAEVGLDTLVEVHDEAELERALDHTDSPLVGVNQRDLVTFEVDQERAVRVASEIPSNVVRVAESGVRGSADAVALAAAGYDALLVGEHLVTSGDVGGAVADLMVPRK
jgi:indole-3-glycerol phosphate synthase